MQNKHWLVSIVALPLAIAVMGACSSGAGTEAKATPAKGSTAAQTTGGVASTGKTAEVKVSLKDNFFEPKDITVNAGDSITFEAKNDGIAIHNMMIQSSATEGKDFASGPAVSPGEESKFTAVFSKPGTIKFVCAYHLPDMAGTITVK